MCSSMHPVCRVMSKSSYSLKALYLLFRVLMALNLSWVIYSEKGLFSTSKRFFPPILSVGYLISSVYNRFYMETCSSCYLIYAPFRFSNIHSAGFLFGLFRFGDFFQFRTGFLLFLFPLLFHLVFHLFRHCLFR